VIDEFGYLPLDQTLANWIFQVVSRRYKRGMLENPPAQSCYRGSARLGPTG
jgi:DNA replication protein DnaC